AFEVWSGGDFMYRYRFLIPAFPLLLVMVMMATLTVTRTTSLRWVAAGGFIVLTLLPGWRVHSTTEATALEYGRGLRRAHLALGRRIAARTSPAAVMAMDDAGLGPFAADRVNIDMLGLNDVHIAHRPGAYGKSDVPYILGRNPDLIVLVSSIPRPTTRTDFI